ncbi:hypothetical protein TURU_113040 [Turdus rufiventris]|nr:hypothetical protein TURU_113040 [Turdus rufiventris]
MKLYEDQLRLLGLFSLEETGDHIAVYSALVRGMPGYNKRLFTHRVFGHWLGFPREVVAAPSLTELEKCLHKALRHMAKHPKFSQPLLIRFMPQILHQLHCPSLEMLQLLNVLPVRIGPKLDSRCDLTRVLCPGPADHTIAELLDHVQLAVKQYPQN